MKTSDETLISAMRILARDIQSEDGIANAAILEAADRLEELTKPASAERGSVRAEFEAFIAGLPFEKSVDRFPESHRSWPGSYRDCAVDVAWQVWKEAWSRFQKISEDD
jgi:hypothetical protein